jgi:hypothetical protein
MKRVTIFIDGSANDRDSLASALTLCRCLDGRLRVVHPRPPDDVVASPDGQSVVLVKNEEERAVRRSDARAAYDEICGGLAFADWQESEETVTEAIVSHGLYSDVVILERLSDEAGPEALTLNTALFDTPGPVLVTPPAPCARRCPSCERPNGSPPSPTLRGPRRILRPWWRT